MKIKLNRLIASSLIMIGIVSVLGVNISQSMTLINWFYFYIFVVIGIWMIYDNNLFKEEKEK